jgi:DNA-binding GntR family transcriptional regulator
MHLVVPNARASGRGDSGHEEILRACRKGDVESAVRAMRSHLNHTVEQTLRIIGAEQETAGT